MTGFWERLLRHSAINSATAVFPVPVGNSKATSERSASFEYSFSTSCCGPRKNSCFRTGRSSFHRSSGLSGTVSFLIGRNAGLPALPFAISSSPNSLSVTLPRVVARDKSENHPDETERLSRECLSPSASFRGCSTPASRGGHDATRHPDGALWVPACAGTTIAIQGVPSQRPERAPPCLRHLPPLRGGRGETQVYCA